ncbi:MAG: hypothetical protein Hens3KO_00180 [Henriciella sp.]
MLPYTTNAIVSRAEVWNEGFTTEPYEAGWATAGVIFLKTITPAQEGGRAVLEISPDGLSWARDDVTVALPVSPDQPTFMRFSAVGCFFRIAVITASPTKGQKILATACLRAN